MTVRIINGDARQVIRTLPDKSVQACVCSPPYWKMRDYQHPGQIGLEPTPEAYVAELVDLFGEVRRVLRDDGTLWVNIGDGYAGSGRGGNSTRATSTLQGSLDSQEASMIRRQSWDIGDTQRAAAVTQRGSRLPAGMHEEARRGGATGRAWVPPPAGIKPKDLIGLPWMLAVALRAGFSACSTCGIERRSDLWPVHDGRRICIDCMLTGKSESQITQTEKGWYLRNDNVWCLSGGTRVYARTQKGEMPMTIKDMARLKPSTVQLWNGEKWTQVLGWGQTKRPDASFELEIRSGQRIGCTASHLWPTQRGVVRTDDLKVGDVIATCRLPQPASPKAPSALDDEMVGWFVGLYIAEGSRSEGCIQIAGHARERDRLHRLEKLAAAYHGTAKQHASGDNKVTVNLFGPVLAGIIEAYVSGKLSSGKHLHPRAWQRTDAFLRAVLDGYLSGDGGYDQKNDRWRLGFTNNDELAADLRTICARLGLSLRLKRHVHKLDGREFPGYRGEIRFSRSDHGNVKQDGEIVAIRASRARQFWDISVADEPHLFALASGVLTHNCKPNGMPESIRDRATRAHEYVFQFSKSETYYHGYDDVRLPPAPDSVERLARAMRNRLGGEGEQLVVSGGGYAPTGQPPHAGARKRNKQRGHGRRHAGFNDRWDGMSVPEQMANGAALRTVWWVAPGGFNDEFCLKCRAFYPSAVLGDLRTEKIERDGRRVTLRYCRCGSCEDWLSHFAVMPEEVAAVCVLAGSPPGGTILDLFGGAGTTGVVADKLQRDAILIELNADYAEMAARRIGASHPMLTTVDLEKVPA